MKYYILTSDKYNFLINGYAKLFERNWNKDIEFTVLGFDEPNFELPNKFKFESLGKQSDWDTWSGPLINYFNNTDEDYFFMCFEDHYAVDNVNDEMFDEAIEYTKRGEVDKIYLTTDYRRVNGTYAGNYYNTTDGVNALPVTSLMPCIWKREFFLKLLHPGLPTPHAFEGENNKLNIKCKTIHPNKIVYPTVDAVRGGKYNTGFYKQYENTGQYNQGCYMQPVKEGTVEVFKEMQEIWDTM